MNSPFLQVEKPKEKPMSTQETTEQNFEAVLKYSGYTSDSNDRANIYTNINGEEIIISKDYLSKVGIGRVYKYNYTHFKDTSVCSMSNDNFTNFIQDLKKVGVAFKELPSFDFRTRVLESPQKYLSPVLSIIFSDNSESFTILDRKIYKCTKQNLACLEYLVQILNKMDEAE
jgi:hypothetical protein